MREDPYADPVTGVLRNKLDLSATGELETAEREITRAALIFLKESPVQPSLRGLPRDVFTERLTYHIGEVNAIHPFREGNGRAQRAFFEQLSSCEAQVSSLRISVHMVS
jgi:cell filamentation protein